MAPGSCRWCHAAPGAVVDPTRWAHRPRRRTPRWPSRHRAASGKRLRRSRRAPQRRWRAADRDLCRSRRGVPERQARCAQRIAGRSRPARKRRPSRRGLDADPACAHAATNVRLGLVCDRPQRERHRDRRVTVVPARRDPARYHRQDRAARRALVAPARDHDPGRRTVRLRRPTDLAVTKPVTVQPDSATRGSARGTADHTRPGSGVLGRRRQCEPPLDVERVMDDL